MTEEEAVGMTKRQLCQWMKDIGLDRLVNGNFEPKRIMNAVFLGAEDPDEPYKVYTVAINCEISVETRRNFPQGGEYERNP